MATCKGLFVSFVNLTLAFVALVSTGLARADDLPVKAVKKVPDLPFFLVTDDRVSVSWMPKGTDAGVFSTNPNGSLNSTTAKQV